MLIAAGGDQDLVKLKIWQCISLMKIFCDAGTVCLVEFASRILYLAFCDHDGGLFASLFLYKARIHDREAW